MIVDHIHDYVPVTVATMMGHEHNTNNRIRYSVHYPKNISPSLVPSSACQRRAFSYITQPLSLLTIISPNYHWSIVQNLKKNEGGPPLFPPWQWSHSVAFRIRAEAGACTPATKTCKLPAATMRANNIVATDTNDVTLGWTDHSERIGILTF